MLNKKCAIICAVENDFSSEYVGLIKKSDLIICADGGYDTAVQYDIKPDVVVGDMDSIKCRVCDNVSKVVMPREKDDTDTLCAVKIGFDFGCKDFLLLGALGSREDHMYANFCVLKFICDNGATAKILGRYSCVYVVKEKESLSLNEKKGKTVSVFPFGCESCSVSYSGLKYHLDHGILKNNNPVGVSNIVVESKAMITVHKGIALIFLTL